MDRKSKESETIYPDLFFSIDDFEQVRVDPPVSCYGNCRLQSFREILIQHEGEKIAVELTAKNKVSISLINCLHITVVIRHVVNANKIFLSTL